MMSPRRQFMRVALGLFATGLSPQLLAAQSLSDAPLVWRQRAMLGFGTTLWLKAAHANADQLDAALDEAVAAIRHIEKQMSLFDPHSALSRLNARGTLRQPDRDLLAVLALAGKVSAQSDGAFDVSMQPLWRLWSQASEQGALPSARAVAQARRRVNWRAVEASPAAIRLNQPGMALSLNGIAQGYCALADALTKVFFMLPPERIRAAAKQWQVDVVLQDKAGRWTSTLHDRSNG